MKEKDSIKSVLVYSDRAYITREAVFKAPKGELSYTFDSISPSMIKDSVKVSGAGSFTINDSDVYDYYDEDTNLKEVKKLSDETNIIAAKINTLTQKAAMNSLALKYLGDIFKAENIEGVIKPDLELIKANDYSSLFEVICTNKESISESILKLNIEKRELLKAKKLLDDKIASLKNASSRYINACRVNCSCEKEEDIVLSLSYVAMRAGWHPVYDARLLYEEKELEILMYALVSQNTGEDWSNISLSISTSKPVISAYLAPHNTWFIDFYIPPPQHRQVRRAASKVLMSKEDRKERECEEDIDMDDFEEAPAPMPAAEVASSTISGRISSSDNYSSADINSSGVDVTFTAKGGQDVPTNGSDKKVFMWLSKFPVQYEYIIMPSVEEAAYLRINVTNSNSYPLVKGDVKVFRDYDFIGDSSLETVLPAEEFKLYLGIDQNIKVSHELINKFSEKKGLGGKDVKISYSYILTLESYKQSEETLLIYERVPISTQKEIEVKVTESGVFNAPDEEGIMEAKVLIKPKEKVVIEYAYYVRYPEEYVISNLV